ncbi:HEAT repeat protein [Saccharomonospora amisosensis]|uniref:HEAT repeat protein n=1 Tax=Saccharomonospora amisosensis TaxID=1128677 RepID=A0A7X5ZP72_9PSEU|nr:HEAT repeat domain-containing protein [Saccharomonospora amisosensis]NIJ10437.1 HEAT repeat protein [Saccharomonospora amisosensis]
MSAIKSARDMYEKLGIRERRVLSRIAKAAVADSLEKSLLPEAASDTKRVKHLRSRLRKVMVGKRLDLTIELLRSPDQSGSLRPDGDRWRGVLEQGMKAAKVDEELLTGEVDDEAFATELWRQLDDKVRRVAAGTDGTLRSFYEHVCKERQAERERRAEQPQLWPQDHRYDLTRLLTAIEREAGVVRHLDDLPSLGALRVNRLVTPVWRSTVTLRPHAASDPAVARGVDWAGFADQHAQVMVLAHPGMGKTWLVRAEAKRLAAGALRALRDGAEVENLVIPVWMSCHELLNTIGAADEGADTTLATAAAKVLRARHRTDFAPSLQRWLSEQVARGHAAVLLDAWDELRDQSLRNRLAEIIDSWVEVPADVLGQDTLVEQPERAAGARLLLTSRIAGYGGPPGVRTRLEEVELEPFHRDDIDTVIDGCGLPVEVSRRLWNGLRTPAVEDLARTPLLLAMLCSIAREGEALPQVRYELYERVLRRLLTRDRTGKSGRDVLDGTDSNVVLDVLGTVAHELASREADWSGIDEELLTDVLGRAQQAREIAADKYEARARLVNEFGLLTPTGWEQAGSRRKYQFPHPTFVEFLLARWLSRQQENVWLEAVQHRVLLDASWDEVIPMLGGLLHQRAAEPACLVGCLLDLPYDPFHQGLRTAARTIADLPEAAISGVAGLTDRIVERAVALLRTAAREDGVAVLTGLGRRLVGRTGRLLDQLRDPDSGVRCAAIRSLTSAVADDERAGQAVILQLRDTEGSVRQAAAECLANAVGKREVRLAFLNVLKGEDRFVRRIARRALADSAATDHKARQALVMLLADTDPELRKVAARSLSSAVDAGDAAAVRAALAEALDDEDAEVRRAAVLTLGRAVSEYEEARLALLAALRNPDQEREVALCVAANLAEVIVADPGVRDAFRGILLTAPRSELRGAAARGLRAVATEPEVYDDLINALKEGNAELRMAAADSLRVAAAVPAVCTTLLELLRQRETVHWQVRRAAALALRGAVTVNREVEQALVEAVRFDEDVRTASAASLADLLDMGRDTRDALLGIVENPNEDPYLRMSVLPGLVRAPDPDGTVREALLELLADRDQEPYIRVPAAEFLHDAVTVHDRAQRSFVDLLTTDGEDPYLALCAVRGLARAVDIDAGAVEVLLSTMREQGQDANVREAAAAGLRSAYADPAVRAALVDRLSDKSPGVCRAAATALKKAAAEPDVWRALLAAMRQRGHDAKVREAVVACLKDAVADSPELRAEVLDSFRNARGSLRLSLAEILGSAVLTDPAVRDGLLDALTDPDQLVRNTAMRLTARRPILTEFSERILQQWEDLDVNADFYLFLRHCVLPALRQAPDDRRQADSIRSKVLLRNFGRITDRLATHVITKHP